MKVYLLSDTHLNHYNIETYCQRPPDFTERIIRNWQQTIQPDDLLIHLGDVFMHKAEGWKTIYPLLPGRKILIRGNHDWHHNCKWWMEHGFDFACDSMIFRHIWLTHKPAKSLPSGTHLNIHGHLHNIWHGFHKNEPDTAKINKRGELNNPWQRLFAVEYTDYRPVEFEHFVTNPDRYQARGPAAEHQTSLINEKEREEKLERQRVRLENHVCKSDKCQCPKISKRL